MQGEALSPLSWLCSPSRKEVALAARGWDIPWLCLLFPDFSRSLVTELASLTSLGEGQNPQEHAEPRGSQSPVFQLPQPPWVQKPPAEGKAWAGEQAGGHRDWEERTEPCTSYEVPSMRLCL